MTDRPISLVLDASAIAAYARSSIHVGEVLAEVGDGGNAAALPVASLVEAAGHLTCVACGRSGTM